jgi:DNA-3-methyladenine glycosylase
MARKLPLSFYRRDTEQVAKDLLGKKLVRIYKGQRISGIIVETEAYTGSEDKACHGFGHRRTERTKALYLDGGFSYVYLIYGMYYLLNAVTGHTEEPTAVLIRAIEPCEGLDLMRTFRRAKDDSRKSDLGLANGPGRLCEALNIDKKLNMLELTGSELFIEDAEKISTKLILATPRIGVDYAGESAAWPLRFLIRDNLFVSKSPSKTPKVVKRK